MFDEGCLSVKRRTVTSRYVCFFITQAAIGSVSLDVARQKGFTGQIEEEFGIQVNLVLSNKL